MSPDDITLDDITPDDIVLTFPLTIELRNRFNNALSEYETLYEFMN